MDTIIPMNREKVQKKLTALRGTLLELESRLAGAMAMHDKISGALNLIMEFGSIDGAHHKQWVLDQVVRILADDYDLWVEAHNAGEDGPETYVWSKGIEP